MHRVRQGTWNVTWKLLSCTLPVSDQLIPVNLCTFQLKTYRARQSKNLSIASSSNASSSAGPSGEHASPSRSRRDSAGLQQLISSPSRHAHRRSMSRSSLQGATAPVTSASPVSSPGFTGVGVKVGHLRQASRSRHSRGASMNKSISKLNAAAQGAVASHAHAHSRSRSRASINMSVSSAADFLNQAGGGPFSNGNRPPSVSNLGSFAWGPASLTGTSVDAKRASTSSDVFQSRPDSQRLGSISSFAGLQHQSQPSLSASPLPPPGSHQRRASRHNRQTSVSNFRESLEIVSGSGTYTGALQPATSSFAPSHNASSSFTSSSPFMDVASPHIGGRPTSPLPFAAWSNDPAKVLEALKERGRLEMDTPSSPEQTRQSALEALEGKVSAPSEMIDLGNEAEGELLVAPKSPGYTLSASPAPLPQMPTFQQMTQPSSTLGQPLTPQLQQSPMIGLGVGVKRNSWSAPGPVTAQGAIGAMGLGSLAEEEEEDEDEALARRSVTPVSTPPRKVKASPARSSTRSSPARSSPRKRPESMRIATLQQSSPVKSAFVIPPVLSQPQPVPPPALPPLHSTVIPVMVEDDEYDREQPAHEDSREESHAEPSQPPFKPPRMRPLSLSSPGGSVIVSANMSPSNSRGSLRASPSSSSALTDERAVSPVLGSSEKPHLSHFHTVAIATVNGDVQPPAYPSPAAKSTPNRSGGLRSLSIGANVSPSTPSPGVLPGSAGAARRAVSTSSPSPSPATGLPPSMRPGSSTSTPIKRSSIGYLNSSPAPSLAQSADGGSASRRPWRSSLQGGTPTAPSPASVTNRASGNEKNETSPSGQNSKFAFAFGGFGDLEQDAASSSAAGSPEDELPPRQQALPFGMQQSNGYANGNEDVETLRLEITGLKGQVEQLKAGAARLESGHALEMAEFEKKAGEEAREMKARMSELEAQLEQDRVARRFEVEGLQREVQQAKDAIEDLTGERDALQEDVDGWRERCSALEKDCKKDREDDALQQAQIKLIGEMRDQIYGLASALEREKAEAAGAKAEVERLVLENTRLLAHQPLPTQLEQQVSERVPEPVVRPTAPPPRSMQPTRQPSSGNIPKPRFQPPPPQGSVVSPQAKHPQPPQHQQQRPQPPVQQQQQQPASPPRHRAFNLGASDGSILSGSSTSASFGRSYSGNTTDSSVATDQDDSSAPPSGHSSFSAFGSKGRESDFGGSTLIQLQTLTEEEEEDEEARADRLRHASGSTGSSSSQELPLTPSKDAELQHHNRSHSFVRHWSVRPSGQGLYCQTCCADMSLRFLCAQFPKGSVSSVRISSEEEHRFFDLDRHASLPPLPFDAEFPPFVDADLTVEEEDLVLFDPLGPAPSGPSHAHRPSSPRPADRMNPHARRFSGQYAARAPPIAPSALAHAAMSGSATTGNESNSAVRSTLARLSFGYFGGGWTPAASAQPGGIIGADLPSPATARRAGPGAGSVSHTAIPALDYGSGRNDGDYHGPGDDRDYSSLSRSTNSNRYSAPVPPPPRASTSPSKQPPPPPPPSGSNLYSGKPRGRYIKPDEVKRPKQSRLGQLDFTPACCADRPVYVI